MPVRQWLSAIVLVAAAQISGKQVFAEASEAKFFRSYEKFCHRPWKDASELRGRLEGLPQSNLTALAEKDRIIESGHVPKFEVEARLAPGAPTEMIVVESFVVSGTKKQPRYYSTTCRTIALTGDPRKITQLALSKPYLAFDSSETIETGKVFRNTISGSPGAPLWDFVLMHMGQGEVSISRMVSKRIK